jgi:hypothetical protein
MKNEDVTLEELTGCSSGQRTRLGSPLYSQGVAGLSSPHAAHSRADVDRLTVADLAMANVVASGHAQTSNRSTMESGINRVRAVHVYKLLLRGLASLTGHDDRRRLHRRMPFCAPIPASADGKGRRRRAINATSSPKGNSRGAALRNLLMFLRYGPTRARSSCFDAFLSAFSKLDNVTPSNRMPLAGGNTVRTRPTLTLCKVS